MARQLRFVYELGRWSTSLRRFPAAWRWTPLAEHVDVGKAVNWAYSLRQDPIGPFYILAAYIIGSLLSFPITILILVAALAFGPLLGSAYSIAGCLLGAGITYGIGRMLGQDFVRRLVGPKWDRVERKFGKPGIVTVATIRLLPVAPFTIVNVVAGAFQIRFRDYFLGSLVGLVPGIIVMSLFEYQLENAIRNPGIGSYVLLAASVLVIVIGIVWMRRYFK